MFNCLTCLSLVWLRAVSVGGKERKQGFGERLVNRPREIQMGLARARPVLIRERSLSITPSMELLEYYRVCVCVYETVMSRS